MLSTNSLFISMLVCLFSTSVSAQSYKYKVHNAGNSIYLLEPVINPYQWVSSNIIVIVNDNDVVVVDSGLTPGAAKQALMELKKITTKPVKYLINTHWHGDHWQGNEVFKNEFPGLEIIATAQGDESIRRNGMLWANRFYAHYLSGMIFEYEKAITSGTDAEGKKVEGAYALQLKEAVEILRVDIEGIKNMKPTFPSVNFENKLTLRFGQRIIQCMYLGIGNTLGDAVVYLPIEKVVVAGDLVVYPSPYESGSFSRDWYETSKKLAELDFTTLLPGHGMPLRNKDYLYFLNELYEEILRQMDGAYKKGITAIDEAKKSVTHESVTTALEKKGRWNEFIKSLDPGFVSAAVQRGYPDIKTGKTLR